MGVVRLTLMAALLTAAGCGGRPPEDAPRSSHRIVVMAPATAEIVERLGASNRVVGIGDFVHWPPSVAGKPRVGGYDRPNLERLLALRADLLVTAKSEAAEASHERIRDLGVDVLALDTSTIEGVFDAIYRIGERLGLSDRADALAAGLEAGLEEVRKRAAGLPRRTVLFVVGREPLYVAGPGSHIDALIEVAGGENIASDAGAPYRMVSLEAMLRRLPDVIVDTSDNRPGAPRGRRAGPWDRWSFVPAVREDRVYHVHPDRLVIPGTRLTEMAELLGRLIHPEVFGEAGEVHFGPLVAPTAEEPVGTSP